eukprot:14114099-Alexandrium_andersonii.AAC.1
MHCLSFNCTGGTRPDEGIPGICPAKAGAPKPQTAQDGTFSVWLQKGATQQGALLTLHFATSTLSSHVERHPSHPTLHTGTLPGHFRESQGPAGH